MNIYNGKKYLKFDKFPHYSNSRRHDYFCKILLNLIFTKLTIRIKAIGYKKEIIEKAKKCFPLISPILRGNFFKIENKDFENFSIENQKSDFPSLYCYNNIGTLVGELSDVSWLLKYDCVADDELSGVVYSKKLKGYIGYSHRASYTFKIGDVLFEQDWKPKNENDKKYKKYYKINKYNKNNSKKEIILENMPYHKRGDKICVTLEDCREAAKNFSKHVS